MQSGLSAVRIVAVATASPQCLRPTAIGALAAARRGGKPVRTASLYAVRRAMGTETRQTVHQNRKQQGDDSTAEQTVTTAYRRTWGDKMVFAGMSSMALSHVVRTAQYANILRFAGPGPMLIGTVLSIYELGGWRLVFGLPASVALVMVAGSAVGSRMLLTLKDEAADELRRECPDIPEHALEALRAAAGREYETNRLSIVVTCATESCPWLLKAHATRSSAVEAWTLDSLRALRAAPTNGNAQAVPPPQTRYWGAQPLDWEVVWQRTSACTPHHILQA